MATLGWFGLKDMNILDESREIENVGKTLKITNNENNWYSIFADGRQLNLSQLWVFFAAE